MGIYIPNGGIAGTTLAYKTRINDSLVRGRYSMHQGLGQWVEAQRTPV